MRHSDQPNQTEGIEELRPESLVRDHLANERTYLAWLRTGIALLGLGFLTAKLGVDLPSQYQRIRYNDLLQSAGVSLLFALMGLLIVAFGTWRYMDTEHLLRRQSFRPLGFRVLWISAAFALIGLAVTAYLVNGTAER